MRRTILANICLTVALALLLAPRAGAEVLKITIDGVIHPVAEERVARAIGEAESTGAEALLIEMRTPGGLETSMSGMIEDIVASKVPVIVYVSPGGSRAASAGFFILGAADVGRQWTCLCRRPPAFPGRQQPCRSLRSQPGPRL